MMQEERVLLSRQGVTVTSRRLLAPGRTLELDAIRCARVGVGTPGERLRWVATGVGLVSLGLVGLVLTLAPWFDEAYGQGVVPLGLGVMGTAAYLYRRFQKGRAPRFLEVETEVGPLRLLSGDSMAWLEEAAETIDLAVAEAASKTTFNPPNRWPTARGWRRDPRPG